jgi:hypothetical protein
MSNPIRIKSARQGEQIIRALEVAIKCARHDMSRMWNLKHALDESFGQCQTVTEKEYESAPARALRVSIQNAIVDAEARAEHLRWVASNAEGIVTLVWDAIESLPD